MYSEFFGKMCTDVMVQMLANVYVPPLSDGYSSSLWSAAVNTTVYVFIVCGADAVCGAPLPYRRRLGSAPAAS
jgi:hypothetical protein